jgi:HrpA-like RNA helicase
MAAISIAKRISEEYDGISVGHNVGYRVGGRGNSVEGSEIMLLTDAALVRMSQDDRLLSSIKVLCSSDYA